MEFQPFCREAVKEHQLTGMKYMMRTEDFVLNGEDGSFEASMFTYSYTRLPEDPNRPVVFAYNGGPGADSGWVHLGIFGPKTVRIPGFPEVSNHPDYEFAENPGFLLDVCDIVLVNPVGTVHTCTSEAGKEKYWNIGGDGDSFVRLILWWLAKYNRKQSPVYLAGESYGTLRNTVVGNRLPMELNLAGIIYIGVSLNVGSRGTFYVEPNVRRLGANAAAVWYHNHREECTLEAFIKEAMDFAYGEYAHALLLGNRLSEKERKEAAEKLSRYTNLPAEFLCAGNIRFSERDFLKMMYPDGVISCYDSRVTLPKSELSSEGGDADDFDNEPFMVKAGGIISACMEEYEKNEVSVPEGRPTEDIMDINRNWSYRTIEEDTLELPVTLSENRPKLRQMFLNGYYDLQSTFDFVLYYLSQKNLPEDRVTVRFYEAGHAAYIGDGETQRQMLDDLRAFIQGK